eukprot:TRINITY_DN72933_c0_g1_i1.p1 TRINITY_DN72933_c0_g1~~TRINITY_DN72933_c0_g1_i1.p1  ORF type:complete len:361 (+),score=37.19 TRINITY_DN72933_c0_g1_i1:394-1476(+)
MTVSFSPSGNISMELGATVADTKAYRGGSPVGTETLLRSWRGEETLFSIHRQVEGPTLKLDGSGHSVVVLADSIAGICSRNLDKVSCSTLRLDVKSLELKSAGADLEFGGSCLGCQSSNVTKSTNFGKGKMLVCYAERSDTRSPVEVDWKCSAVSLEGDGSLKLFGDPVTLMKAKTELPNLQFTQLGDGKVLVCSDVPLSSKVHGRCSTIFESHAGIDIMDMTPPAQFYECSNWDVQYVGLLEGSHMFATACYDNRDQAVLVHISEVLGDPTEAYKSRSSSTIKEQRAITQQVFVLNDDVGFRPGNPFGDSSMIFKAEPYQRDYSMLVLGPEQGIILCYTPGDHKCILLQFNGSFETERR